ncbi:MAG: hypothetical protein CMP16_04405 [Rickettsiales bacterium]|nr:hypothetical protein [Rickettsiales bacterium]
MYFINLMHWIFIIIGILSLSLSISNPVYNLIFKNKFKKNIFIHIFIRFLLFISSIILIFIGLYIESI